MATVQAAKQTARQLKPNMKNLIYEMHCKLYPHLYDGSGKQISPAKEKGKENWKKSVQRERETENENEKVKEGRPAALGSAQRFRDKREFWRQWREEHQDRRWEDAIAHQKNLIVYPPKTPIRKTCADPVSLVSDSQIRTLDPTGARTRLFAKTNLERAQVGDILLVRQRTGEPFAGVCINIRRRGVDTAILLRGQLTRVGVEMWFKVYSPLVEGIEVVQRAAKRARRARLTFMRLPKHDKGSVENVVRVYMRQKAALGSADGKKKGGMAGLGGKKGGNKRGGKRR